MHTGGASGGLSYNMNGTFSGQPQTNGGGSNNGLPWGAPFPSLHMWPIQDTFAMKMIHLPDNQRIKIGRQTNNKTIPGERNAYFDSKVLSRTHAEIWEQGGKIYMKDMKSSNGTFINSERLSPEGMESEPFEVKTEDLIEFGIDIISEDNRSIVHHKVAAKVYCVFGGEDAALSARELVHYNQDSRSMRRPTGQNGTTQVNPMSQMGPVMMSSGGKVSGLSFDHVLHKLQTELAKSKETGAELQILTTAMNDIQDTLGGGLPPSQNGAAVDFIPPQYRSVTAEAQAALAGPHGQQAAAVISLQNQLTETQSSLSTHLNKIQELEGQLKEHATLKHELGSLREQMETGRHEMDQMLSKLQQRNSGFSNLSDDDDDARSVVTLMDNEDAEERVRLRRASEEDKQHPVRPPTPEPHLNGHTAEAISNGSNGDHHDVRAQNAEMVEQIRTLTGEIARAEQLSKTLEVQHNEAMSAVRLLTTRVGALEEGITSKVEAEVSKAEKRWESWKVKFEEGWRKERETWESERERLRGVVREWEEASRRAHEEVEDRELNESLSEDGYDDEDGGEGGDDDGLLTIGPGWKEGEGGLDVSDGLGPLSPVRGSGKGSRRRRPSQRGQLAVRALKSIINDSSENNGSSTPKAESVPLGDSPPSGLANRLRSKEAGRKKGGNGKTKLGRNGSNTTIKVDKDSSESGKDSGDTLIESDKLANNRKGKKKAVSAPMQQPIPILTVIIVAVFAGAIWYRNKE